MDLFARIEKDTGRRQLLYTHLYQVGELCAGALAPLGLESLGRLAGYLHDAGKATQEFQQYLLDNEQELKGKINHSYCGARWVNSQAKTVNRNAIGITATILCAAISSHHGRGLTDILNMEGEDALGKKISGNEKENYAEAIDNLTSRCFSEAELQALLQQAVREVAAFLSNMQNARSTIPAGQVYRSQYDFYVGLTCRLLHSCLVDADRYDAYCFANEVAPKNASALPWQAMREALDAYCVRKFKQDAPASSKLNALRDEVARQCLAFAKQPAGIYRLYVPTGGNKTISAMLFALSHTQQQQMQRIFYIAPYKTILSQNAAVYREALGMDELVLEHHGDATGKSSEGDTENLPEDSLETYELLCQRWSGNRVILTSMVQFLHTLFHGKATSSRRFSALARSVIILDEVQSLPPRFVAMFNSACDFLAECCGSTIVLCTATQPDLPAVDVPLRLSKPEDMVPMKLALDAGFRRTHVADHSRQEMTPQDIAEAAYTRYLARKSTLIILNTKADTLRVYGALEHSDVAAEHMFLLSTSLCPQHRNDTLGRLRDMLDGEQPVVCVSTQLIEAGIDISFDFVMRALAGLDSIAQSAGRCNRNADAVEPREVWVIRVRGENLDMLEEIRQAQTAAGKALDVFAKDAAKYGNDLLHPAIIKEYYGYYYNNSDALLYPASPQGSKDITEPTTLYDLLSGNRIARKNSTGKAYAQRCMAQSFRTAGYAVQAIEGDGYDVLVPYGAGRELIAEIEDYKKRSADREDQQLFAWLNDKLKQAQRYIVRVYPGAYYALRQQNALRTIGPQETVIALAEGYYDSTLGLKNEPGDLHT